jgi:hypothetical protein
MTEFGELRFKIVRVETAGHEVLGRLSNLIVARAAFDVSVSLWPSAWIELRQKALVAKRDVGKTHLPTEGSSCLALAISAAAVLSPISCFDSPRK